MTSDEMGWTQAQSYCNERNGSLIVFDSPEEWENFKLNDIYKENLKNKKFWLGHKFPPIICDSAGKECFKLTDLQWWCTTFPETCTGDDCIHVHQKDGKVHRKKCEDLNQVVCEKGAITQVMSTPTSIEASTVITSGSSVATDTSPVVTSGSSTATETPPVVTSGSSIATETSSTATSGSSIATETSPAATSGSSTATETSSTVTSSTSTIEISPHDTSTTSNAIEVRSVLTTTAQTPTITPNKMTDDELLIAIQNLRAQLTVKKNNTSLYRRQFISMYESRASSVALGSFAITFLVLILCLITVPDIISMVRFLSKRMTK